MHATCMIRLSLAAALLVAVSMPTFAQQKPSTTTQIELFGVKLKNSVRNDLRQALRTGGMNPVRDDDDRYWYDTYKAEGVMEGASNFIVGYVQKTQTFAIAQYEFNGFMDKGLVTKIANLVKNKYGRPNSHLGNDELGPVTYTWNFSQGMAIHVKRGWPDTTTYLSFTDQAAYAELQNEMQESNKIQEKAKAKQQTKAF